MMQGQTRERVSPAASPKEQEWAGPEPVIRPQAAGAAEEPAEPSTL